MDEYMSPLTAARPSPKDLSDRELLEAVYRAIYGEEPIQPGIAKRVWRLELGYILLILAVSGFEGARLLLG